LPINLNRTVISNKITKIKKLNFISVIEIHYKIKRTIIIKKLVKRKRKQINLLANYKEMDIE
jgi:hypothetical protein